MIKQIHCWRSNFSISQWTVLLIGLSLHIWMNEAAWWRGSPPSINLDMAKPMTTESVIRVTGHTGGGTIEASPSRITSIASPVKHWIQRRRTRDGGHAAISTHTGSWCLVLLGVASELKKNIGEPGESSSLCIVVFICDNLFDRMLLNLELQTAVHVQS